MGEVEDRRDRAPPDGSEPEHYVDLRMSRFR